MSSNTRDNDQLHRSEADKGEKENNPTPPVKDDTETPAKVKPDQLNDPQQGVH